MNPPSIEQHPLQPFLPSNTKVLFLGSFPPQQKRWCMPFFYPNYINDHWRITGDVFFGDKDYFVDSAHRTFRLDAIKAFLLERGIGYYDTASAVRRLKANASDKYLEIVTPTDIPQLTQGLCQLTTIVTTGELATLTLCSSLSLDAIPKVNERLLIPSLSQFHRHEIYLCRLPSSSRAYPLAFEKKSEAYRQMYALAGML